MRYIIIILSFFAVNSAFSQNFTKTMGIPFVKNFYPQTYNAHEQNFDIVQDKNGVMYFANFQAVLIYDGQHWTKVPTNSGMRVLSLDISDKGIVFVGGLYDFGFIQKDKFGKYNFITLIDSTSTVDDIGEIKDVLCIKDKTYFLSENKMFIYDGKKIRTISFHTNMLEAFAVNKQLFLFFERNLQNQNQSQNGLTIFRNGKFIKLNDNSLAQIVDVKTIFYLEKQKMYIMGTESQGFFKMQNNTIESMNVPINDFVTKNSITCGAKINDNLFVIGTLTKGVLLVDQKGNIVQILNKKSSLADESINNIFVDYSGNIWLATNGGITLIETNNSITQIPNESSGIQGKINKIIEFNKKLYVVTDNGLYFYSQNQFEKVEGMEFACWDATIFADKLFLASPMGVFYFDGKKIFNTSITDFSFCLKNSSTDSSLLFIGNNSKISVLKNNGKIFTIANIYEGFKGNVTKIAQNPKGNIYIEVPPGNIYKLTKKIQLPIKLKTGNEYISLHINTLNNQIFFASEKGIFIDNNDSIKKFDFFSQFNNNGENLWLEDFFTINKNNFLFTDGSRKNISKITKTGNQYKILNKEFLPISNFLIRTFFFDKSNKIVWFGGSNGILLYNFKKKYVHNTNFSVLFSQITNLNKDTTFSINNSEPIKIQYNFNSIRFEFAAPYFPAQGQILYSYFLDGFDNGFSEWTNQSSKEYTNLPANNYTFYVKAQDQFGNKIKQAVFKFKILVPLYRTWWAILIYLALIAITLKLFIDWRMKKGEEEKLKLEEIIKERTAEIEKSKAEIEAQRDIEYKQRKEIMDSIHYAKRIQQAVLPTPEILNKILENNYFVVFSPYEVVSGDYFWIKQLKNFIVIVAADCTGHGVPGAFMSMLGTSFLNEIVTRRSLDNAAEVLEHLRNKVKSSLHQEGKANEQKDGMDISIYFFDKETNELQYSGAYNSLYIVRENGKIDDDLLQVCQENPRIKLFSDEESDNEHTLIELKANRQPIGIYIRELPFDNITLKLKKGDCIYSFSDGYQDQFGGDTGEKFNIKRFKKMFLNIQGNSMAEQKRIIEQNFVKWKGDQDQIDDVLVFGLRIE